MTSIIYAFIDGKPRRINYLGKFFVEGNIQIANFDCWQWVWNNKANNVIEEMIAL